MHISCTQVFPAMAHLLKVQSLCVLLCVCLSQTATGLFGPRYSAKEIDFMDPCDIVRSKNYPCENHDVVTADGYILSVHRIPYGRKTNSTLPGRPIELQHGQWASSAFWIIGEPEEAFGYVLADAGYDVWMPNARGNRFSMRHLTKNPKLKEFWGFSADEYGVYDQPAIIDYILNATGHDKLYYVGHSMGGASLFITLTRRPEYNDKIRLMIGFAPGVYHKYTTSIARIPFQFGKQFQVFGEITGMYQSFPYDRKTAVLLSNVCCNEFLPITKAFVFSLFGESNELFNVKTFPAFLAQMPAGQGLYINSHVSQGVHSNEFRAYNFPTEEINMQRYGQRIPPLYNLTTITAPVVVFHSNADTLDDSRDLARAAAELGNLVDFVKVDHPKFNHIDYAFALNASKLVFEPTLRYLEKFQ